VGKEGGGAELKINIWTNKERFLMIIGLATNMTFEKEGDDISDGCLYS
jgi:hypothetical protein